MQGIALLGPPYGIMARDLADAMCLLEYSSQPG